MFDSILMLIILSLFLVWLFFIWAVKKGEFDDVEGPKYRMLDDDLNQPDRQTDQDQDPS